MEIQHKNKIRVLAVDDDPIVEFIWKQLLADSKYQIEFLNSGSKVLEIGLMDFDIIFMDINMPKLDGIATTKLLRKRGGYGSKISIIGITSHLDPEIKDECFVAGMNEILTKPILPKSLNEIMSRTLNKKIKEI